MLNPDVEARRTLVKEHRADLAREALREDRPKPDVMESRARRRRWQAHLLLRFHLRPARGGL